MKKLCLTLMSCLLVLSGYGNQPANDQADDNSQNVSNQVESSDDGVQAYVERGNSYVQEGDLATA